MRVVVAEDSVLLREGLVRLIEDEGALVVAAVPLRVSPHERAPTIHPIVSGAAVWIENRQTRWTLVRATDERLGWVPNETLAPIGNYLTSR